MTETVAQVAAAVSPSVVAVNVVAGQSTSAASGIILSSDGLILTKAHVVNETSPSTRASTVRVTFSDGKTTTASMVGTDTANDIAVLKASGVSGLIPATLGSSSTVQVGDTVVAIGSPLGLQGKVTSGFVSALHRTVKIADVSSPFGAQTTTLTDAIQTDARSTPATPRHRDRIRHPDRHGALDRRDPRRERLDHQLNGDADRRCRRPGRSHRAVTMGMGSARPQAGATRNPLLSYAKPGQPRAKSPASLARLGMPRPEPTLYVCPGVPV